MSDDEPEYLEFLTDDLSDGERLAWLALEMEIASG